MLYITDLSGNTEPLLVNDVHVTQQLNTVEQIDFTTVNIDENKSAFDMLKPRSIITLPETGEMYRLTENDGATLGLKYQRTLTGLQVLQDMDDHIVNSKLTGSQSLDAAMNFITAGTKFTYMIHDQFDNFDFGEDGIGEERSLSMFTDNIVTNFKIEFKTNGYHIDIYKKMGEHDSFVFVSGSDVYALAETGDYTQIRTHIYGVGKTTETETDSSKSDDSSDSTDDSDDSTKSDDDKDTTVSTTVKAEYTSPNASIYGVIDDDIYTNDNATTEQQLITEMKAKLVDYPQIQYTANVNKFETASPADKLNNSSIGNWGYIRDRNGTDIESRIIQKDLYPQSPQDDTLTFGNFMLDPNKMIAELKYNRDADNKKMEHINSGNANVYTKEQVDTLIQNAIVQARTPDDIDKLFDSLASAKNYSVAAPPLFKELISGYGSHFKLSLLNTYTFFTDLLTISLNNTLITNIDSEYSINIYAEKATGQKMTNAEFIALVNSFRTTASNFYLVIELNGTKTFTKRISISVS